MCIGAWAGSVSASVVRRRRRGFFDHGDETPPVTPVERVGVFFLFAVASMEEAQRLIDSPEFAQAEKDSGVIDGEYHFVESARGY